MLLLAPLELAHQPAQELVQLLLFLHAQRRRHERLLLGLRAHRLLPGGAARIGELDEDAAAVVGVGQAPHEPGLLQPVEPVRHRSAREIGPLGQLPDGLAMRRPRELQVPERLPLAVGEAEVRERLVEHAAETPPQPVDPVDDALHFEIDGARQLGLLEPTVDVVALVAHRRILIQESLDVKIFEV